MAEYIVLAAWIIIPTVVGFLALLKITTDLDAEMMEKARSRRMFDQHVDEAFDVIR